MDAQSTWMTRACMVYGGTILVMLQMGNVLNAGPVLQYSGYWLGVWIEDFLKLHVDASCRAPHYRHACKL